MTHPLISREKMATVYINELGVRPWESAHPTNDGRFTTTTLLSHDFNNVWKSWCEVMEPLSEKWSIKRQWDSALTAEFSSKTEEYLFKKNTAKTLHNGDLFKKMKKAIFTRQSKTSLAIRKK